MIDLLSVILPVVLVLSLPTYFFLRERARRKAAEAALQQAGLLPAATGTRLAAPGPFVPWRAGDPPAPAPIAREAPADALPAPADARPAGRITMPLDDAPDTAPPTAWVHDPAPPAGIPAVRAALDAATRDPFAFGIMWVKPAAGGNRALVYASLADGPVKVNFLLGTGEPEHGKNVLVDHMLIPMLQRATPQQLRICVFDGTRADGAMTRGLAHNWIEPLLDETDVPAGLLAWRLERKRRERLLDQHGVTKWERLPDAVRPPMLLFVVNEITVLAKGMSKGTKVEDWLDVELKAMRKCGMRAWLFTQNVSGMQTSWRDSCSMKLAGYQPVDRLCEPNTGLTAAEVRRAGALGTTELIEKGMFTLCEKGAVLTGRTSYLDDDERIAAFQALERGPGRQVTAAVAQIAQALGEDAPDDALPTQEVIPATPPAPTITEAPAAQIFSDLPMDDQYSLIRAWKAAGQTGNEMVAQMRPMARHRALALIRQALGQAASAALLGADADEVQDAAA